MYQARCSRWLRLHERQLLTVATGQGQLPLKWRHLVNSRNWPLQNIQNKILFEHKNPFLGFAQIWFYILLFYFCVLVLFGVCFANAINTAMNPLNRSRFRFVNSISLTGAPRQIRGLEIEMELKEALAKFHVATGGELYYADWEGGTWMCEAVQTRDELIDFVLASKNYRECGELEFGELAGFPFAQFGIVQVAKGKPRRRLSVIDFGEFRFAFDIDLTDYTA